MTGMSKALQISQLPFKGLQACSDMQDYGQADDCVCLHPYAALAAQSDTFRNLKDDVRNSAGHRASIQELQAALSLDSQLHTYCPCDDERVCLQIHEALAGQRVIAGA